MPKPRLGRRQIKANDRVTYHAEDGDVPAKVIRFEPYALLQLADGTEVRTVREGTGVGQWTSIPPRR